MKKFVSILILLMASIFSNPTLAAQKTYIVVGDSILSFVGDGSSDDLATHLVAGERDVVFKNISSPGASLAATTAFGFNSSWTTNAFDHICGYFSYCDGIILQAGVNDFLQSQPWTNTNASLVRILNWAQAKGKKVLMLDLIWQAHETTPNSQSMTLYNYRVGRALQCGNYPGVCYYAARPAVFDAPSTMLYTAAEVSSGTQTHPNIAGHREMADWIESAAASAGLF